MTDNNTSSDDNIFFSVIEEDEDICEIDFSNLLNELNTTTIDNLNELSNNALNENLIMSQIVNYNENYTVKELMLICEYYNFAKELKQNKCNKNQIIEFLVMFELNPINADIVFKRQNMWFYINELKKDKMMKKYVLW